MRPPSGKQGHQGHQKPHVLKLTGRRSHFRMLPALQWVDVPITNKQKFSLASEPQCHGTAAAKRRQSSRLAEFFGAGSAGRGSSHTSPKLQNPCKAAGSWAFFATGQAPQQAMS